MVEVGTREGMIEAVSAKLTKKGNHMRYGVKIGEDWFNSFRDPKVKKGDFVSLKFAITDFGKDILEIQASSAQVASVTAEQPQHPLDQPSTQQAAVMPAPSGKDAEIRRMSALRSAVELLKSTDPESKQATEANALALAKRFLQFIEKGE